jgi:outer membrane receptor protein involved in Fe transport
VFVHYNLEVIAWNQPTYSTQLAGNQREYGVELEATYHTEKTRLQASHGFTQLYDFDLKPGQTTYLTGDPYGYGHDLAYWSNHVTKLAIQRRLDDQWTFNGSLRIYWGYPGMKDYDQYVIATNPYARIEPGWERAYRGNYYLDLGLQYAASKNLTVGLMGYYLLGLFDADLNKRNYIPADGDFRSHAPSLSVWAVYKFR